MPIKSYFIAVAFYMLGGSCIYLCMRRVLSHLLTRKSKMIDRWNLAICSVVSLGGVGLTTFAFFYLQN